MNVRLWTWKDGTQSRSMRASTNTLTHPAILNTEVVKVERPEGGKVKVSIKERQGWRKGRRIR
jgi:hypothetical protein